MSLTGRRTDKGWRKINSPGKRGFTRLDGFTRLVGFTRLDGLILFNGFIRFGGLLTDLLV
jgi:hypothetical protein